MSLCPTIPASYSSARQAARVLFCAASVSALLSTGVQAADNGAIGAVLIGKNQYVECLATGVLKELEPSHLGFVGQYSNFAPDAEISGFSSMITKGVKGVLVLPVTPQSAGRGALTAKGAGIPVVNLAWALPTAADSAYAARVKIDNIKGGHLIAEWLGKNAKPGKIVVVEGAKGNEFNDELLRGLREGVTALGSGWSVAGVEQGFYQRAKAVSAVQDLLTANPDSRIIVDFAAEMGDGIASFLEREKRTDIVHVTSDGNPEMVDWIKKGFISAVRYYSSAEEGRIGAHLMLDALQGRKLAEITEVPMSMETAKTIDAALAKTPLCYSDKLSEAQKIP